jgi:uncharacterized protein with PIN domain
MIVTDSMLGKLTVYLRMLGYDVKYISSDRGDSYVEEQSSGNILLTRDRDLHRRVKNSIFLSSYDPREQLKEVIGKLPPPDHGFLEVCTVCGSLIEEVKDRENLPEYVNRRASKIYKCPGCGRYYWDGSHTENFRRILRGLGIEVR